MAEILTKAMGYMYKHWLITKRWPGETANLLVYPFIGLLSVGLFAYFLIGEGGSTESILFVLVGVVSWNFYEISQRGITYAITYDIWNDCLKHGFSTSARFRHFLLGNAVWSFLGALFTLVTVGLVGLFAFGANVFAGGIILIANMFVIFLFALGIGLIIDFLMLSKGEKWMSLIWMSTGIFMIFSGVYYPITILPGAVKYISMALPPTHSLISLRAALGLQDASLVVPEFLFGLVLAVLFLAFGMGLYKWGVEKGKKNGIITKY